MERVIPCTTYNYYKYYNSRKEYYKMNYLERKRREKEENKYKNYYRDYWINARWKDNIKHEED